MGKHTVTNSLRSNNVKIATKLNPYKPLGKGKYFRESYNETDYIHEVSALDTQKTAGRLGYERM